MNFFVNQNRCSIGAALQSVRCLKAKNTLYLGPCGVSLATPQGSSPQADKNERWYCICSALLYFMNNFIALQCIHHILTRAITAL